MALVGRRFVQGARHPSPRGAQRLLSRTPKSFSQQPYILSSLEVILKRVSPASPKSKRNENDGTGVIKIHDSHTFVSPYGITEVVEDEQVVLDEQSSLRQATFSPGRPIEGEGNGYNR